MAYSDGAASSEIEAMSDYTVTPGSIVEIGPIPFVARAYPEATQFYSTWAGDNSPADRANGLDVVSLRGLPGIIRQLRDPALALIVVHSFPFAPWNPLLISRMVFRRNVLRGGGALVRALGQQTIRAPHSAPIAVLDFEDYDTIPRSNIFMLDRATTYFKRELPTDSWRVFAGSLHRHTRTPRFRMAARHCKRLAKIRPLSLGLPLDFLQHGKPDVLPPPQKTTDVFFAGKVAGSSTVRARGLAELRALRERGYAIDIVDERIPPEEFRVRCARAWITWSPEGLGWQCFRHFEALACGSVPLCNHSGLQLHKRLMPGIHALYYDVEPGDLTAAIVEALADRPRLEAIAARGRDYVFEWHTPSAIARYVVETTLSEAHKSKAAFQASR